MRDLRVDGFDRHDCGVVDVLFFGAGKVFLLLEKYVNVFVRVPD